MRIPAPDSHGSSPDGQGVVADCACLHSGIADTPRLFATNQPAGVVNIFRKVTLLRIAWILFFKSASEQENAGIVVEACNRDRRGTPGQAHYKGQLAFVRFERVQLNVWLNGRIMKCIIETRLESSAKGRANIVAVRYLAR